MNVVPESGAFLEGSEPWITVGASLKMMMMFYGFGLSGVPRQLFSLLYFVVGSASAKID